MTLALDAPVASPRVASRIAYSVATDADDADLRALLRENRTHAWVDLAFEREPAYGRADQALATFGDARTIIAHDAEGAPVGMCSARRLAVAANGTAIDAAYLGELRIAPRYRRSVRSVHIMRDGFAAIRRVTPRPALWFTSIAAENATARRLLEARLPGMPIYTPRGSLMTLGLATQRGRAHAMLQPAQPDDAAALAALSQRYAATRQLAPRLTVAVLQQLQAQAGLAWHHWLVARDGAAITAAIAVWDQSAFKQTRVRGYRPLLASARPLYNVAARIGQRVMLPPPGATMRQAYLAFAMFDRPTLALARVVVESALAHAEARGLTIGVLGLAKTNPLTAPLARALGATTYETLIQTVHWPDEHAPTLDHRLIEPDIALL